MSAKVSDNTQRLIQVLLHHRIDRVIDIGAHQGEYASRLRRGGYAGAIVSVEPQEAAHRALIAASATDPDWVVAPRLALGAAPRTATLNVSGETDMSSLADFTPEMAELLDSAAFVGSESVTVSTLDMWFGKWAAPDDRVLVKIDTQGTELAVLEGAADVISRISLIQIEMSVVPVYAGEPNYRAMIDRLADWGFAPVLFIPGYFNKRTARLIGMDGIFAPIAALSSRTS